MSTYLYNGVELPQLPEWDKTNYPYAAIFYNRKGGGVAPNYQFVAVKEPITRYYSDVLGVTCYYRNQTVGWVYRLINNPDTITDVTVWEDEYVKTTVFSSTLTADLIWSNHDVTNESDGSIYLPASDPVPVGGEHTPQDFYVIKNGVGQKHDSYVRVGDKLVKQEEYLI